MLCRRIAIALPLIRQPYGARCGMVWSQHRTFSTRRFSLESSQGASSCWKCQAPLPNISLFCSSCGVIQSVQMTGSHIDLFKLFKLDMNFFLDMEKLDSNFKELQGVLHPDKFMMHSRDEQSASLDTSSTVNQGYQVLRGKGFFFTTKLILFQFRYLKTRRIERTTCSSLYLG